MKKKKKKKLEKKNWKKKMYIGEELGPRLVVDELEFSSTIVILVLYYVLKNWSLEFGVWSLLGWKLITMTRMSL